MAYGYDWSYLSHPKVTRRDGLRSPTFCTIIAIHLSGVARNQGGAEGCDSTDTRLH